MEGLNNSTLLLPDSNSPLRLCYPLAQPDHPCNRIVQLDLLCNQQEVSLGDQQECICSGEYFRLQSACIECARRHGLFSDERADFSSSVHDAVSTAFCEPKRPTQSMMDAYLSIMSNSAPPGNLGFETESINKTPLPLSEYYTSTSGTSQFTPSVTVTPAPGTTFLSESTGPTPTGGPGNEDYNKDDDNDGDNDGGENEGAGEKGGAITPRMSVWATLVIGGMLLFTLVN